MTGVGAATVRRLTLFAVLLVGVDFLDEVGSGIAFVASPDVQAEFSVSYGQAAGWLLFAIMAMGHLLEPPLFLLADRFPRRWFVCGGLAVLGASCLLAGFAPVYGVLLAALLLYGPASGCGVGLSQATLMDAWPDQRERMMVRWTLSGSLGDLATPALLALVVALGGSWRHAFVAVGVLLIAYACALWRQPFPRVSRDALPQQKVMGIGRAFATALRHRRLLLWGSAVVLCDLLDEILVAFGALRLRDVVGVGVNGRAAILSAFVAGGTLGLVVAERFMQRFEPRRLLIYIGVASAVAYSFWLSTSDPLLSGVAMFAVGLFSSTHYPIAKAQAYRAFPGRSGSVNAVITLLGVSQLPVPIALGWVADHVGLGAALSLLALQPLGLIAVATFSLWHRTAGSRDQASL